MYIFTAATSVSNFYMVTDTMYTTIYQIDTEGHSMTRAVEIEPDNEPISLSYNSDDNTVYWVDKKSRSVKMKSINGSREKSLGIDVSEFSNIAIDVTGGNIYVKMSNEILLFTLNNDVKTILQKPDIKGQPGKIAIAPSAGYCLVFCNTLLSEEKCFKIFLSKRRLFYYVHIATGYVCG